MRTGVTLTVDAVDRARLEAAVADRNRPQKHVWRARIILLTAGEGNGGSIPDVVRQTVRGAGQWSGGRSGDLREADTARS